MPAQDIIRPAKPTRRMKAKLKVLERADPVVARLVKLYLFEGRQEVARRYAARVVAMTRGRA